MAPRWVNVPNRDYWLAPERREQAFNIMDREMGWFGLVLVGGMMGIIQLVNEVNLKPEVVLPTVPFLVMLFSILGGAVLFAVRMVTLFRVPR